MTLKEKLNEKLSEAFANEIEQIADEFAIGFGQWLVSNCYSEDDMYWWLIKTNGDVENVTIKELLEIYKKEKGL